MTTLIALTLILSAYGFVVTILLLNQKALRKEVEKDSAYFNKQWKSSDTSYRDTWFCSEKLKSELFDTKADRDQLAQALKETQAKLDSIKVRRDAKTGRMVSAKRK